MSKCFIKQNFGFLLVLFLLHFTFGVYAQEVTTFDTPGTTTFTVPEGVTSIEYLVIAGGGGGGAWRGGGGGAGGLQQGILPVTPGAVLTVTVGAGGAGAPGGTNTARGANGQNSVFGSVVATGGGGGGIGRNSNNIGGDGGSGGGEGGVRNNGAAQGPGLAIPAGQGFAGGDSYNNNDTERRAGGGGGGAGAAGAGAPDSQGGTGGIGIQNDITGTLIYYAGGGGGASDSGTDGSGGLGGGGTGNTFGNAQDGEANSGGGGGAAGGGFESVFSGGDGGSGIVILSYILDTDGDGVPDENDYDNDNDGIADLNEGSTCYQTEAISGVTTGLNSDGDIATLYDGNLNQQLFYFLNNQTYPGSATEIFNITFVEPLVITEFKVLLNTDDLDDTQNNSFLGNNVEYQIQGFNGTSWDVLGSGTSDGVVSGEQEVFSLSANTTAYSNYRILWVGGGQVQWDPWIEEILFTVAPCAGTSLDSDNDGIANYLDLDSDNDGILDADEILNG
ncbi:hypothetical protein G3567_13135, partial [Psychroflexus sp. YR1-1]|nr:hypothetical protein [Psychroflexus aurantiacus]